MDLWKSWNIIRRRAWIIVVFGAACFVYLYMGRQTLLTPPPPTYVSTVKLLLNPPRQVNINSEVAQVAPGTNWMANLTIMSEMMLGQDLIERVAHRAKLNPTQASLRDKVELKSLAENNGQITLLQLSVTWTDPKTSKVLAKALAEEFIEYSQDISAREYASTRKFLQGLVEEAKAKLAPAEAKLLAWRREHKVLDASQAAAERQGELTRAQAGYATALEQATRLQSEIGEIKAYLGNIDGTPPWAVLNHKNDAVAALQERLAQARLKLADLERIYLPKTEVVRVQRAAVDEAAGLLHAELASYANSLLKARELELHNAEAKMKAARKTIAAIRDTSKLAANQLEYARLERQVQTWDRNYQSLLSDLYRARVLEQSGSRQGAISIIQQPEDGTLVFVPPPRDTRRSLPVSLIFALMFGVAAAFAVEYLFVSMHVRTRIEETLGVPVVGVIPRLPREYVDEWDEMKTRTRKIREQNPPPEARSQSANR